jgi:transcriptional/translational regulatory protein YebC/TACO1
MFDRVGQILYPHDAADDEAMFEAGLDAGADNVESDDNGHEITTAVEDYNSVREALEQSFGTPEESDLTWKPHNTNPINEDQAQTFMKLMDALDDLDDVQNVASNVDIPEDVMAKMNG